MLKRLALLVAVIGLFALPSCGVEEAIDVLYVKNIVDYSVDYGTANITAGNKYTTVPHKLGTIPDNIQLTLSASTNASIMFWPRSLTIADFVIEMSSTHTSIIYFYWRVER